MTPFGRSCATSTKFGLGSSRRRRHPHLLVDHRRAGSASVADLPGADAERLTGSGGRLHFGMVAGIKSEQRYLSFMSISCNDVIILAPTNALISIRGRPYHFVLEATRLPACAPLNFNAEAGTITIREGKSGKPHRVVRSHKGRTFFAELTAGAPGASSFSSTTMARHVSHRTSNARWTPRAPAPR